MIEPFVITQEDANVTQSDTTAEALQDLFVYRVPKGIKRIILRPEDVLASYMRETDDTAAQATGLVKLEWRDATGTEKKPLVQEMQYANFNGEFQDEDKLVRLDIPAQLDVLEREYIALMSKNALPYTDKDLSYFELRCHREV